jgi:hypothetical protein
MSITIPATEEEYTSLKTELESIRYELSLVKRINTRRYLQAVKDQNSRREVLSNADN